MSEHTSVILGFDVIDNDVLNQCTYALFDSIQSKRFNQSSHCYVYSKNEKGFELKADYCIGLDWLGKTGRFLYVEPKINSYSARLFNIKTESEPHEKQEERTTDKTNPYIFELDYLKMLLHVTAIAESNSEINDLIKIDWNAQPIKIEQKDDRLTPFLVVRFLQTLKAIVRKGLKKDYYKVQENLSNRVKGKILVSQHFKQNVFKNRFTNTYCEYQVFGEDHAENRFLKKVLQFSNSYVENNKNLFGSNHQDIQHTINFCLPAFTHITNQVNDYELKHSKYNPFYKDYKEVLQAGSYILKRFGYNITQTATQKLAVPPFWIDMPRLFELYVYSKMIEANPVNKKDIHFQFSTYGNALDILVSKPGFQMVIDAKYKLQYQSGHLHEDIRQVAGYARLNKVREKLNLEEEDNVNIDCLIIYPDMENGIEDLSLQTIKDNRKKIEAYYKVYKLGVKLPWI
ncbi:McrC family protein [Flavobacterium pectinovorum]|uniref:McrC family protein n=1 Tax=Flavobacterium pectinovorum TaxID=29533 RepID=UPI001FAC2869|nr:McrC family protein [Flavobacterium pectinovorum]